MARNSLILLLLSMVVAAPAMADRMYKWVDQHGNISYQDKPPPEGRGGKIEERSIGDRRRGAAAAQPESDAASGNPVTLYVTSSCTPCDQARAFLKGRDVPFREIDVSSKNPQAQQEMQKKLGELAVPTITIGPKVLRGFTAAIVASDLEQAGYPKPEKPAESDGSGGEGQNSSAQ